MTRLRNTKLVFSSSFSSMFVKNLTWITSSKTKSKSCHNRFCPSHGRVMAKSWPSNVQFTASLVKVIAATLSPIYALVMTLSPEVMASHGQVMAKLNSWPSQMVSMLARSVAQQMFWKGWTNTSSLCNADKLIMWYIFLGNALSLYIEMCVS